MWGALSVGELIPRVPCTLKEVIIFPVRQELLVRPALINICRLILIKLLKKKFSVVRVAAMPGVRGVSGTTVRGIQ